MLLRLSWIEEVCSCCSYRPLMQLMRLAHNDLLVCSSIRIYSDSKSCDLGGNVLDIMKEPSKWIEFSLYHPSWWSQGKRVFSPQVFNFNVLCFHDIHDFKILLVIGLNLTFFLGFDFPKKLRGSISSTTH